MITYNKYEKILIFPNPICTFSNQITGFDYSVKTKGMLPFLKLYDLKSKSHADDFTAQFQQGEFGNIGIVFGNVIVDAVPFLLSGIDKSKTKNGKGQNRGKF